MPPTIEYLNECVSYDSETGKLTWKKRPSHHFCSPKGEACWNGRYPGTEAGYKMTHGYILLSLEKKRFLAHRVAWAITHGHWPENFIDHIDHDPGNNRISNLRKATKSQNGMNTVIAKTNTSGFKGVSFNKKKQKWVGYVRKNHKTHHLGQFSSAQEANEAVRIKRQDLHGEFTKHA